MARFSALLVLLALACLGVVTWVQLDRPVTQVTVNGQLDEAERQQIRAVVVGSIDGGLLSADLEHLKTEIRALSWPRSVSIRRSWPAGLALDVSKPLVIARWQDAYLGNDGQVVRLPGPPGDLPTFDCSLSDPLFAMEIFHRLSEASSPQGLEISELSENELGEWSLTFTEGVTLKLGAEELPERLARFLSVYTQRLAQRFDEVAQVDARYANGVAVSWRSRELDQVELLATIGSRKSAVISVASGEQL